MTDAANGVAPSTTRVAVVHITDPKYNRGGADRRALALHESLGRHFESTFYRFEVPRQPVLSGPRVRAALSGTPIRASQVATDEVLRALRQVEQDHDLVVGSTLFTAALVPSRRRLVFDAHNLEWHVMDQLARTSPGSARRAAYRATKPWMKAFEARLGARSAAVWAVSREEAAWFERYGARVSLVPNGVDLPIEEPGRPRGEGPQLLFVGSLQSVFNQEGVRWFLDSVWPRIRSVSPTAEVKIIGAGPESDLPDGAVRLGFVDELAPHYADATLCLAPLLSGSGTRLKVLEGMAFGRAVVSTTVGAEGLEVEESDGVLIADDPAAFADACLRVIADPGLAASLGSRARHRARAYSWPVVTEPAVQSIHRILSGWSATT